MLEDNWKSLVDDILSAQRLMEDKNLVEKIEFLESKIHEWAKSYNQDYLNVTDFVLDILWRKEDNRSIGQIVSYWSSIF